MRILTIHSDFIEFEPKKPAGKFAEEEINKAKESIKDCLVVFTAVEKSDEGKISETAQKAVEEIKKICDQVKTKSVVLYPFAHLSSELSSPATGLEVLKSMQTILDMGGFSVTRAPFGWYKSFTISCKGHPLAELSRVIGGVSAKDHKAGAVGKETKRSAQELEEYDEHDHRRIGKEMDLLMFHEWAPGQPFWLDRGMVFLDQLKNLMREKILKRGYARVQTPLINSKELYEKSGHWDNYRENMFLIDWDGATYCIKPMNCPDHALVFKSKSHSYRDLPIKISEWTTLYRNEISGALSGLFRVIGLQMEDAHIYCRENQIEEQLDDVLALVKEVYDVFGFSYEANLSTKPEKYMGPDDLWDRAEKTLESVLKRNKIKYKLNPKDGAFYGPKIDIKIKDSLDREWQCATIQLDFNQANRFDLSYSAEDDSKQRPVVIHRAIYGSFERFAGILIEHYDGKFPTWLAPVQAVVIPLSEKTNEYSQKIYKMLRDAGVRVEMNESSETVQNRIRKAHTSTRAPYILVLGEKEESAGTVAVRTRDGKVKYGVKAEEFLKNLQSEIREMK